MIDPRISLYLNILLAVLGVIAGSASYFTGIFGEHVSSAIVGTAGLSVAIIGAVNSVLHAYSAPKAGLMVRKGS